MPTVSQQQRVNVEPLTANGCLLATKCFVEYALATILNERGLVPGGCFVTKGLTCPTTGKTYQALKFNFDDVAKYPVQGKPSGPAEDPSNKLLVLQSWLKGVYEALDQGYLQCLTLEVLSPTDHQALESYVIDFKTTQGDSVRQSNADGTISQATSQSQSQRALLNSKKGHKGRASDKDQVREQMYTMLAQLKESLANFAFPPTGCLLSMSLQYTSSTPPEYEPLCFCAADQATRRRSTQLALLTSEGRNCIQSGWATPFNSVTVKVIPPVTSVAPTSTLITPCDSGRSSPASRVRRIPPCASASSPALEASPPTPQNRSPSASVPSFMSDLPFPTLNEATEARPTPGGKPTLRIGSPGPTDPTYVELLLAEANRLSHVDPSSELFTYLSAFVFVCSLPGDTFNGVFPAQHPAAANTCSTPAADEATPAVILQHLVSDGVLTPQPNNLPGIAKPRPLNDGGAFLSQLDTMPKVFIIEKSTRMERLCHMVRSAQSLEKPFRVLFNKAGIRAALETSQSTKAPPPCIDDHGVGVSVIDRPCRSLTPASTLGTTLPSSCPSRKRKRHG